MKNIHTRARARAMNNSCRDNDPNIKWECERYTGKYISEAQFMFIKNHINLSVCVDGEKFTRIKDLTNCSCPISRLLWWKIINLAFEPPRSRLHYLTDVLFEPRASHTQAAAINGIVFDLSLFLLIHYLPTVTCYFHSLLSPPPHYFTFNNDDSFGPQVYQSLDIVTAKVTPEERNMAPHHMLDVVDPLNNFSVIDFRDMSLPIVITDFVFYPFFRRAADFKYISICSNSENR